MNNEEKSKECDNCLQWLDICNVECCREYTMVLPDSYDKTQLVRGATIKFFKYLNHDKENYYRLHGVRYAHGWIFIMLNDFKVDDNKLIVYFDCKGLTVDRKCLYHDTSQQPPVCKKIDKTTQGITLTENCLFKYK